jgi:hypothetical protein
VKLVIVFYLFMAAYFFTHWLELFEQEPGLTSKDSYLFRVSLIIATIFWPVIILVCYLYLFEAEKLNFLDASISDESSRLHHLIISIFLSNLLTISGLAVFAYIEFVHHIV